MSNSISGQALAGSTMVLSQNGANIAITTAGPTGLYSFSGLSNGTYVIAPSRPGISFSPVSSQQVISGANIVGVNFLGQSVGSQGSTYTIQNIVDRVKGFADIEPIFNVGGFSFEPALTIANDVFNAICAVNFPHKWNRGSLPLFYTWSWQQDYALVNPDSSSVYGFEWLEKGIAICISSTQIPKPWTRVECGRDLPKRTGAYAGNGATQGSDPGYIISWLPNSELYYGTWGAPNILSASQGNNPKAGSVYVGPIATTGMPANPISQIIDSNANLLVITSFGTEGANAPTAPIGALPGTQVTGTTRGDASTTVWTVVDPVGMGVRIDDVPSQTGTVWQFNIDAQFVPPKFTNLDQVLSPLPDKFEPFFRSGFVAQAYRYSKEAKVRAKFKEEWELWLRSLVSMREAQDRELEEFSFVPERTVMGSGRSRNRYRGPSAPFNNTP